MSFSPKVWETSTHRAGRRFPCSGEAVLAFS